MMFRVAAVRPDGTIARVVVGSSEDEVDKNMPAGTVKIDAPVKVRFGTHTYDFSASAFRLAGTSSEESK